ncbi:hypothetical protein [Paraburkholderia strydomiana]|uniref:hypothetical protein n=1 Tax=Paraburkholderia strydomiana TaxID=1245417 RepID=UPI0038BC7412
MELVHFLRECDRRELPYTWTPFFAFSEMPHEIAQERIGRFDIFAKKFGIFWQDGDPNSPRDFSKIGRVDHTRYGELDRNMQSIMGLSFASFMLMHIVNRDLAECSPIGRFRRFTREYRNRIPVFSGREITIARYIFADQQDCPRNLDEVRIQVDRNFGRHRKKRPVTADAMEAAALNGASDLLFLNAMNIADTKGIDGTKLDCWLLSFDRKLRVFCDFCYSTAFGTGQAGAYLVTPNHTGETEYWDLTEMELRRLELGGARRLKAVMSMERDARDAAMSEQISKLPEIASSLVQLAVTGL